MPIWSEVAADVAQAAQDALNGGASEQEAQSIAVRRCDDIRTQCLASLAKREDSNVILYISGEAHKACGDRASITYIDTHAFMTVVAKLPRGKKLDLILHSGGGSPEVVAAILQYLRPRFGYIRVFVPQFAMSAAALLCLGCDRIVMASHSALGPTDPQMRVGDSFIPAHAIVEQFKWLEAKAKEDTAMAPFYAAMLPTYGPGLLKMCENFTRLSRTFAEEWLRDYMFAADSDAAAKAKRAADYFSDHGNFQSHSRHIFRDDARAIGLTVDNLEEDKSMQDDVLTAYHAATISFRMTTVEKIIENHLGTQYPVS